MDDIVLDTERRRRSPMKAAEVVAAEIRNGIADGRLQAGGRLPPQDELAQHYEVSAPTMREALRMLETDGLITVVRGVRGGTVVNAPNLDAMSRQLCLFLQQHDATISDMLVARIAIEPTAVRLLAERCTPDIEAALRSCIADEREARDDATRLGRIGARFHALLLQHSGNTSLQALGTAIVGIVESNLAAAVLARGLADRVGDLAGRAIRDHERLVNLLAAGRGPQAEQHWRKALQAQLAFVQENLDIPLTIAALG